MKETTFSWVLPIKDEALSLSQLLKEIKSVMRDESFEIVAVNDASNGDTKNVLTKLGKRFPQLKSIHFSLHQGKWAALTAGLNKARGEVVITLDSDLQDDPQEAKKLLQKLNNGYDLVSGWRRERHDLFYKVWISRLGNWLVSILTNCQFRDLNSPFKIYRREILDSLPTQGSLLRFTLLFAHKLGYQTAEVPIIHRPRLYGQSKFGLVKYLRIIFDLLLVLLLFSGSGRIERASLPKVEKKR